MSSPLRRSGAQSSQRPWISSHVVLYRGDELLAWPQASTAPGPMKPGWRRSTGQRKPGKPLGALAGIPDRSLQPALPSIPSPSLGADELGNARGPPLHWLRSPRMRGSAAPRCTPVSSSCPRSQIPAVVIACPPCISTKQFQRPTRLQLLERLPPEPFSSHFCSPS